MTVDHVIKLCAKGKLSIGKAVEILNLSIYDMHKIAKDKGVKLSVTKEQMKKSKELLDKLLAKKHGLAG